MANKKVKLKNRSGDYLYPYTDNIPAASSSTAGKVKIDAVPTENSNNAVTSGAVYTALAGKLGTADTASKATADASGNNIINTYQTKNIAVATLGSSGTINLSDNSINRITPTGDVSFTLPVISDELFHQILVQMTLTAACTINLGTSSYFTGEAPNFEVGMYDIVYEHNGSNWAVGAVSIGNSQ